MGLETVKSYSAKPSQTELNRRFTDLEKRMQHTGAFTGDVHSDTEHVRRGQELAKFLKTASLQDIQTLSYHPKAGMLLEKTGGYPEAIAGMDADKLGVLALNKANHQQLNSVLGSLALPPELLNENPNLNQQRQQARNELHAKLETISYSTTSRLEKGLRGLSNQLLPQQKEQVNNLIKEGLRTEKLELEKLQKNVKVTPSTTPVSGTNTQQSRQQKEQQEKLAQQRRLKEQQEKLIAQAKLSTSSVPVPEQKPVTVDSFISSLGKGGNEGALRQDLSKLTQSPELAKELMAKVGTGEKLQQLMRLETSTVNQASEIEARKQRLGALLPQMSNEQIVDSMKSGQLSQIMSNTTDRYAEVASKAFSPEQVGIIAANSNSAQQITALGKMVSQLDPEDKTFAAKLRQTAEKGDFGAKKQVPKVDVQKAITGLQEQFERKVAVMNTKQEIKTGLRDKFTGGPKVEAPKLLVKDVVLSKSNSTSTLSPGKELVKTNVNSVRSKVGDIGKGSTVQSHGNKVN